LKTIEIFFGSMLAYQVIIELVAVTQDSNVNRRGHIAMATWHIGQSSPGWYQVKYQAREKIS